MFKIISEATLRAGERVLLRLDCNVPISGGGKTGMPATITDDFRLRQSMKTINYLREHKAKIIIVAHLENKEAPSLEPVAQYFRAYMPVSFVKNPFDAEGHEQLAALSEGEVALIENIRNWEGEKKNDPKFAQDLAGLADVYVNEAFSVSHREHASIVGVPKLIPGFAGFCFAEEVAQLSKAFEEKHPYIFVLGGAKFETKMPLVQKFLKRADTVFIGGALVNDLYKAKGYEVGESVVSESTAEQTAALVQLVAEKNVVLPEDVIVTTAAGATVGEKITKKANAVVAGEKIVDISPISIEALAPRIAEAKMVLWNGPMGFYEGGYVEGTEALARAVAAGRGESLVGGGDTLAAIAKLGLNSRFTFLSTAGGAMLDFLANETLPGIKALG